MSAGSAKPQAAEKQIATNPNRGHFHIDEVVEAGIMLQGTEIKSIRSQSPSLKDAFVEISSAGRQGSLEAWLVNAHIAPYSHGNIWNHEPNRRRKLLLHRHQIKRMFGAITQDGMTIIPTRMYFKLGRVKVECALAKGKKQRDKRQDIKKRDTDREIEQAMKRKR